MPATSPPIGIRLVEIHNFRGIESLSLDFSGGDSAPSDIVVLGGPNGCGKTAVLEACLLGVGYQGELQGAKGAAAARGDRRHWDVELDIATSQGNYHTVSHSNGQTAWYRKEPTADLLQSLPVPIPCLYISSWRTPKLVGALSITAGKRGRRPSDSEQNRIWRAKQHLIDSRAHMLMLSKFARLFDEPDPYDVDRNLLNEVWATFYPQTKAEFVVEPVSKDPSAGFDVFLVSADGARVAVDALSSGQLELFALFGALMLARFQEGIVVVDEPELHLDPQWHAVMVRAMRKFLPKAQLLIATHSPKVYDSVMSFQRHFLVPENDPRAQAWKPPAKAVGSP